MFWFSVLQLSDLTIQEEFQEPGSLRAGYCLCRYGLDVFMRNVTFNFGAHICTAQGEREMRW